MSFIYPPINAKFATLILIGLVAIGTKAKKERPQYCYRNCCSNDFRDLMIFSSLIWQNEAGNQNFQKYFLE
jgi:hypothetical protein